MEHPASGPGGHRGRQGEADEDAWSVLVTVSGKRGSWTVDPADLPLRATVVLDAGRCGDALFPGPAGVAPTCAYDPGRGKVKCK